MKESSEKALKVNIEPRLNIDDQQDDKIFEGKLYIYDSDEVYEIIATRTPMK